MVDKISPEERSRVMSKVKGKDTKIERFVRSALHRRGFRFRKNVPDLPGKPDIVLPKYRTVIFVNGCFWHQHEGCKRSALPATRTEYWKTKLTRNVERDRLNTELLESRGWRVLTLWECRFLSVPKEERDIVIDELEKLISTEDFVTLQHHGST